MKVVLVCPRTPRKWRTGLENVTLNLAKQLKTQGVQVEIFTTAPGRCNKTKVEGVIVHEFSVAPQDSFFFSLPLFFALRRSDANVIHVNGYNNFPALLAIIAKKRTQKLVLSLYLSEPSILIRKIMRLLFDLIIKLFIRKIDFVIYSTESERRNYCELFKNIRSDDVMLAVDKDFIEKISAKREKNRLLSVGRMVENKGFKNLIHCFKEVCNKKNGSKLVLIGDGPYLKNLKALTKELGIEKNVEFKGAVYDRAKYIKELKKSTAFILLLPYDNVPLVFIEALATKTPIIGSKNKPREFGEQGLMQALDDPEDYLGSAQKILQVLENPTRFVPKNAVVLSWKDVGKKLISIYKTL